MGGFRRRLGLGRSGRNGVTGRFFGPGELRLALLALLAEEAAHGYALMTRLEERCGGAYQASAGGIYPTLQQLEDEKLVRAELDGDGRKRFSPTPEGRRELSQRAEEVEGIWSRAAQRGEWGIFGEPDAAEIVGPALRLAKAAIKVLAHAHGDPEVVDEVRAIIDGAREQIERLTRRRRGR
jgi:DNA-binding PadR family transcriptional regulator